MDDINVGRLIKSNHNFTEKVRSMILDKDLMREHYMNEMLAFKSHELISSRLASMVPGSPYAAAEEEEQAQTNPNIRSLARLKKEAEDIRIMFEDILERKVINLEILLTQLDKDNEIRNEILQQELEKEWEKKKSLIYAMNNQQLLDEHKKLAEELRVREEKRLQELKAEETRLLSRIADLDISIKRHYENIDKLQAGINQRNIRIKELEASIAGRHVRIDALEARIVERHVRIQELEAMVDDNYGKIGEDIKLGFAEMKNDKKYIYNLPNLEPDEIAYLKDRGENFSNQLIIEQKDILSAAQGLMIKKYKDRADDLDASAGIKGYLKDLLIIKKYGKLSAEAQEKYVNREMSSDQMLNIEKEINDLMQQNKYMQNKDRKLVNIKEYQFEIRDANVEIRKANLDVIEEKVGVKNEEREVNEKKSENKKDEIAINEEIVKAKKEEVEKEILANDFHNIQDQINKSEQLRELNFSKNKFNAVSDVIQKSKEVNLLEENDIEKNISQYSDKSFEFDTVLTKLELSSIKEGLEDQEHLLNAEFDIDIDNIDFDVIEDVGILDKQEMNNESENSQNISINTTDVNHNIHAEQLHNEKSESSYALFYNQGILPKDEKIQALVDPDKKISALNSSRVENLPPKPEKGSTKDKSASVTVPDHSVHTQNRQRSHTHSSKQADLSIEKPDGYKNGFRK